VQGNRRSGFWAMNKISGQIAVLLALTKGLPPFRRDKFGTVEGWPPYIVNRVSEVITAMAHASSDELREAILQIESTDRDSQPDGLMTLLGRVAWDSPASPDPLRVSEALQRGSTLREALFGNGPNASTTN